MFGTGAKLSSEQEQEKLRAYRDAQLGGADLTDSNTLEDARFQNWDGSEALFQAQDSPTLQSLGAIQAAAGSGGGMIGGGGGAVSQPSSSAESLAMPAALTSSLGGISAAMENPQQPRDSGDSGGFSSLLRSLGRRMPAMMSSSSLSRGSY